MKKPLSIALVLVLMLSLSVPAFADVSVDGESKGSGEVTHDGDAKYVSADAGGDSLTVTGNVNDDGKGNAINATGGAEVTVEGNVTESGSGLGLQAVGATIIVIGNVEEKDAGDAVSAVSGATVKVGGNVTDGVETAGASNAVSSGFGATVIVEGVVTGDLNTNGQSNSGTIYIGQLKGDIKDNADLGKIHYLIGTADGSAALSAVTLVSDIVATGTIDGVKETGYKYTTTADKDSLKGKTIILKPADGKILTVSGFDGANVTYAANENGTVTFTIGDTFTGGLQNLVLILADKPGPDPGPAPVYYYVVPAGSVTVVALTAPEGLEEDLITKLDSADHAGLTVDASLVGKGSVKVLKGDEELSGKDFRIYTHRNDSIDIILSNTYLYALGSGSYDFTAIVDGMKIPFTVAVAK